MNRNDAEGNYELQTAKQSGRLFSDLALPTEESVRFFTFSSELFGSLNAILDSEGYTLPESSCFELYFSISEYFACLGVLDYLGLDVKNAGITETIDFYLTTIVPMYRKH